MSVGAVEKTAKLVKNALANTEMDWGFLRSAVVSVVWLQNKSMAVFSSTQILAHAHQQKSAEVYVERNCSLLLFFLIQSF